MDEDLAALIDTTVNMAYMDGITVQSDYARRNAAVMAAAASMGLLTTEGFDGSFGRVWRPTYDGYLWVKAGTARDY